VENQIKTELSPKFTEMKTGGRVSRFGRPQKETKQDANTIPTELSKFLPKNSPKRSPKSVKANRLLKPQLEDQNENLDNNNQEDKKESNENIPMDTKPEISAIVEEQTHVKLLEVKKEKVNEKVIKTEIIESRAVVKKEIEVSEMDVTTVDHTETSKSDDEAEINVSKDAPSDEEKSKQEFSDTDSALGSASSCHEGKSSRDEEFAPGKIMWGSFNKTSWYPCMIYPNEDGKVIIGKFSSLVMIACFMSFSSLLFRNSNGQS
jgi:hypothetical protein